MKTKSTNINKGAAVFSGLFGGLFFLLILRFLYIQITGTVDGNELPVMAEQKYSSTQTIEADRGSILDRQGIPIAQDMPAYTLIAVLDKSATPKGSKEKLHIEDPEKTAEKIAPILGMEENNLLDILKKGIDKERYQVELGSKGRGLSYQVMQEINALKLPGIKFKEETIRYYPNGTFATHVIGFARKDSETGVVKGLQGLENTLDKYLAEEDGKITKKSDRNGISLLFKKDEVVQPKNGYNVYLTIDQKIQAFLEDAMNKVVKEYEPENIVGIVADPKTGAILGMSSRPTYNPNDIPSGAYMLNDPIALPFEPGSTMKMFTLATAIEEGVFNPNDEYQSGTYRVYGDTVRDHNNGRGWGRISYLEGFQRSSNVAMANLVMEKMNGDDRLLNYLKAFGFGEPTGIDLPGEESGKLVYNYPLEKVATSFGQGSSVTPIQQIQAATAIANGGKMMQPYIIDSIVEPGTGKVIEDRKPQIAGTPISEETADQVMDILETVVSSENGTGKPYRIEGYEIAGKTGTAQVYENGELLTGYGENIFSFLGMAPKVDPKLLVYIAVRKPKLKEYESGSQPVSEIFKSVVKNSLQYLNIKPKENGNEAKSKSSKKQVGFELSSYEGRPISDVTEKLSQKGARVIVVGNGKKVTGQAPYASSKILPGERVLLKTDGDHLMPDLTSWSLRDVMKLSDLFDLKLNIMGNGYVKKQNIPPDSSLKDGDQLVLEMDIPNSSSKEIVTEKTEDESKSEDEVEEPLD